MIPTHENPPAQSLSTNQNVYPGHRILVLLIRFGRNLHKFVQRRKMNALHVNEEINDGLQATLGPQDNTRETQAADSGTKKLTIFIGGADEALSIRAQQFKTGDVATERAGPMMILAVNIIGNSPTNRDKPGTRINQPRGTTSSSTSASETPASQHKIPSSSSKEMKRRR